MSRYFPIGGSTQSEIVAGGYGKAPSIIYKPQKKTTKSTIVKSGAN